MPKLCEMEGVRGGEDGFPVEIWRDDDTGKIVLRGYNEAGYSAVDIDLNDLRTWLAKAEGAGLLRRMSIEADFHGDSAGS